MIKKLLLLIALPITIILTIVILLLFGAANPILNRHLDEITQIISADLGRPIQLKSVDLKAFPNIVFHLEEIDLSEMDGTQWVKDRSIVTSKYVDLPISKHPSSFVHLHSIDVRFDTWRAITSLGSDLIFDSMSVDGVYITLHRDSKGRWNFEDLPSSEKKEADKKIEKKGQNIKKEDSKDQRMLVQLLRSLKLKNVALRDVHLTLVDHWSGTDQPLAQPRVIDLIQASLEFPVLDLTRMIQVELNAAILNQKENFTLSTQIGPFDEWLQQLDEHNQEELAKEESTKEESAKEESAKEESTEEEAAKEEVNPFNLDLKVNIPFPIETRIKADKMAFKAITPYLPPNLAVNLTEMIFDGNLHLLLQPSGEILSEGLLKIEGVKLKAGKKRWGPALKVHLAPVTHLDLKADQLTFNQFSIKLNDMGVYINGAIKGLKSGAPQLDKVLIESRGLNFSKILKLLPPVKAALPSGTRLAGPLSFHLKTSGDANAQSIKAQCTLDQILLVLPNTVHKKAGIPLAFSANIDLSPKQIKLRDVSLTLSDLKFSMKGAISPRSKHVRLNGGAPPFNINRLVRLAPAVQRSIPSGVKVNGDAGFDFNVNLKKNILKLKTKLSIQGANLNTPVARLIGGGDVRVEVNGNPQKNLYLLAESRLSGLDIKVGDAFDKPKGVPLDLSVEVKKSGAQVRIPKFQLNIASLSLRGVGTQSNSGFSLKLNLKPSPLRPVLALLPATRTLGNGIKSGKVGFKLKVSGGSNLSRDLSVELNDLTFTSPKNKIKGSLSFRNPRAPISRFNLTIPRFHLDELSPPQPKGRETQGKNKNKNKRDTKSRKRSRGKKSSALPPIDFIGKINVKRGQARGIRFKDMIGEVKLKGESLHIPKMSVKIFKGEISLHPIKVKLPKRGTPRFNAQFDLKKINLTSALKQLIGRAHSLSGTLSSSLTLKGRGDAWETIAPTLQGKGSLLLKKGKLKNLDLKRAIFSSIAKKIPAIPIPKRGQSLPLKTLKGSVKIKNGNIHFKKMSIKTPEGPMKISGRLGVDGKAKIKAKLNLSAKRVSKLIKKRIKKPKSFPITFGLSGPLNDLSISNLGSAALISAVLIVYGAGQAAEIIKHGEKAIKKEIKKAEKRAKKEAKKAEKRVKKKINKVLKDLF